MVHWHGPLVRVDVDIVVDIDGRGQSLIIAGKMLTTVDLRHAANSHQLGCRTIAIF